MNQPSPGPGNSPAERPTLLFQHIPKTAGTSLRHALGAVYPEEQRAYVYDPADLEGAVSLEQFRALPEERRARLRFVMGHFPYGIHEALGRPFRYVTILRHPLDRVASLYYHFKLLARTDSESRGSAERARIEAEAMSLEDWVFGTRQLQADNGIVRQIAARPGVSFGQCPDDLLAQALEHIDEHYEAVLIRGMMSPAIQVLEQLVGQPLPPLQRRNANPGRAPLSAINSAVQRRIIELNELDGRLFRLMVERLPATYERIVGRPLNVTNKVAGARPAPVIPTAARQRPSSETEVMGDRTLLFMHIAKTGGTSVRNVLVDAYAEDERAFVYDPADLRGALSLAQFQELPEEERARLRLVMGHFQYGIHHALGRPFSYTTILRDPVDRVVSLYYHYRDLRGLRIGGRARDEQSRIRRSDMSLEEWVFGQQRLAVDNGMTRNIAARPRIRFGQCPDDLLTEALEHVDRHFVAVIASPDLGSRSTLLEEVTSRRIGQIGRDNVNRNRSKLEELDPGLLDRIRDLNRLDAQLYIRFKGRSLQRG